MKIDRLIAIIVILLEHEVISARELAEKLEVSRRTIYRDIDTLTFAGLPIFTHQGATGGVGLMKSYKVDKKLFTRADVQTLVTSLKSYKQLFNHKEIVHVLEKLSAIGHEGGTPIPEGKFVVDLSLKQGNESLRTLLSHVETALNEDRCLIFDYVDKAGHVSSRKVEPYRVVFKESSWYLQGYCVEKRDYRIFKLARMSKLEVSRETFVPRDFSPLPMDGADWMNQDWISVTIRIDRSMMDKVIERFGEGNVIKVEENTCLAAYPIIPNEFGYDKLLAFGDKCEIVGPSEVREGFRQYVGRILAKYEQ
ncbi:MAG: YafY family transcriptional regulator [Paenibacillus macerans]|uniref:helix-turn-helix transcriptional regulator n=1 Tax=Paenibacillus macerans TaxID=44252 RepID=UPI002431B292|nr:YafY family protein [Paenibacillus macerans]MBS5910542.1 YafY family transcriptional regulator [Paenibacillus macerans]MDU5945563.1 YafY family protein [Paenibacillus macerans]